MSHFNIWNILSAFWSFIYGGQSRQDDLLAIFIMILGPLILTGILITSQFSVEGQYYGSLVSIFSIFAAFLFAAQISVFTVFRLLLDREAERGKNVEGDPIAARLVGDSRSERVSSLIEGFRGINASISYLVLVSVVILALLFIAIVLEIESRSMSAVIVFLSSHFLLVLIVVVRMCHEVFNAGYES